MKTVYIYFDILIERMLAVQYNSSLKECVVILKDGKDIRLVNDVAEKFLSLVKLRGGFAVMDVE